MFFHYTASITKMFKIPKIYRFTVIPVKIPKGFFSELGNIIAKFVWKHKRPRVTNVIMKKESKAGGTTIPDLKIN